MLTHSPAAEPDRQAALPAAAERALDKVEKVEARPGGGGVSMKRVMVLSALAASAALLWKELPSMRRYLKIIRM